MRELKIIRFFYFNVYVESIKIIPLHVISRISVWIKTIKGGVKMLLMNRLNARVVATLGAGK
ncbi:hypothetical protein AT239_01325 [Bartonella henselae]|nr:hypothetical protein AT240_01925 [Bartonella henselae]OLL54353.1 hypothetical protein AT239_01325 [Bartonella henselae]